MIAVPGSLIRAYEYRPAFEFVRRPEISWPEANELGLQLQTSRRPHLILRITFRFESELECEIAVVPDSRDAPKRRVRRVRAALERPKAPIVTRMPSAGRKRGPTEDW